jgi:hypothetical protein
MFTCEQFEAVARTFVGTLGAVTSGHAGTFTFAAGLLVD